MSISVTALEKLKRTNLELSSYDIPTDREFPPVKRELQLLTEYTFIYILKLLGIEDEKKLSEILLRLKEGTPFYDFTFLVYNLSKSETDFDFLTLPENIPIYNKIAVVSEYFEIHLLPYANVLKRIAENKQYGLYQENQEIIFFLDEYYAVKDSIDIKEFMHQFRKILKYKTQLIFERFFQDNIFYRIKEVLSKNETIENENTLCFYVYGFDYYNNQISNEEENSLHDHIGFCISYLAKHGELKFQTHRRNKFFPIFKEDKAAVDYFFSHDNIAKRNLNLFIPFLKDVCPREEIFDFCNFLRNNIYKDNGKIFDDSKSFLIRYLTSLIQNKAFSEKTKLYQDIFKLLPQRFICERSPCISHGLLNNKESTLYMFYDDNKNYLFSAFDGGNQNETIPEAHVFVEVNILKKNNSGLVECWNWHELKENQKQEDNKSGIIIHSKRITIDGALRAWRMETASKMKCIPEDILDDVTLSHFARSRPVTRGALPNRFHNKLGDEIINIIRNVIYARDRNN